MSYKDTENSRWQVAAGEVTRAQGMSQESKTKRRPEYAWPKDVSPREPFEGEFEVH